LETSLGKRPSSVGIRKFRAAQTYSFIGPTSQRKNSRTTTNTTRTISTIKKAVLQWDAFKLSVQEAATLARPHDFDYLESFGAAYAQFRRYLPQFLDTFEFRASPACAELLKAVDLLRELNETAARHVLDDAPIGFIRRRWQPYVFEAEASIDAFTNCAC
jgi:hypothetical protein